MKKSLFAIAAAAAVLAGCQMEEFGKINSGNGPREFRATIVNSEDTRTMLAADGDLYHVNWIQGDKITVSDGTLTAVYTAGEGGTPATWFSTDATDDQIPVGPVEAFYPSTLGMVLPYEQEYVENGVQLNPMYAKGEMKILPETTDLSFKNLCGILKFNLTSADGAIVKNVVLSADKGLSGAFTVNDAGEAVVEGTMGASLNCTGGVALSATPVAFNFVVPAGEYKNLKVTVNTMDNKTQTLTLKADAAIKVERSKVSEGTLEFNKFAEIAHSGSKAILPAGIVVNAYLKGADVAGVYTIDGIIDIESLTTDSKIEDTSVKGIIFQNNSSCTTGIEIQDPSSEFPIYLDRNATSGLVVLSTPADQFATGEDCANMFYGLTACRHYTNLNTLNTEAATNMYYMFGTASVADASVICLESLDLSSFKTDNVTNMEGMLRNLRKVKNLDVSKFNTSNVETFKYMFGYAAALQTLDVSNFDFTNCLDAGYMFYYLANLKELKLPEDPKSDNVENMRYMFYNLESIEHLDVSKLKTTNCYDMGFMFMYCGMLQELDLSSFDFTNDTTLMSTFAYDSSLVQIIWPEEMNVENLQNIGRAFRHINLPEIDLSKWQNMQGLTGCSYVFRENPNLTKVSFPKDVDFSAVTTVSNWFYHGSENLKLDLTGINTETLPTLYYLFSGCWAGEIDCTGWNTESTTSQSYNFYNCLNLHTLRLGDGFLGTSCTASTCWFAGTTNKPTGDGALTQTGFVPGHVDIYCSSDVMDWVASRATVKYVNDGYYNGVPCPVKFFDWKTNAEMNPGW